ncbi:hypothetical protein BsWGS_26157 [Bradybaena similaris]
MKIKSGKTKGRNRLHDNDGWAGFDGYANAKKQKLDEQFNQRQTARGSTIFAGVAVYVNGYTNPSSDELRRILQRNGGRYEMYLSKTRVTHIVATNLPNSKYRLAETIPVVKPEWITDSEAAGKRLSHIPYLLLGNKSKLQSGLKGLRNLAPVVADVKAALEFKTDPLAHGCDNSETRNVKVETVKPNVNCDIKFHSESFLTDSFCEVKHAELEGQSEIVEITSHPEVKLSVSDRISIMNDDDDDVVYNSEEDHNNEEDKLRSTTPCLSQNDISPYKKRSRVYSFRKFRKSNSITCDAHGMDSSSSCDGFIEGLKSGLLDCGEGFSQKGESSLLAGRVKYSNYDASSDSAALQNDLKINKKVNTVGDKLSLFSLSHASAGALETLQSECSQIEHEDGLELQTEWLSQKTEPTKSNTSDASLTAGSVKQVHEDVPATSCVSDASHLSLNSTSLQVSCPSETSMEPTYPFLKQLSNTSSATFLLSTLDQTHLSSRESPQQASETPAVSALEPANLPLAQACHRSSTTSSNEPAHPSSKQTFQRPSSSTMAKTGDKHFLREFYSNSRLHHIATWGAEFKAYVSEIQKSSGHSFPGRERLRQLHVENALKCGQPETLASARHGSVQKTVMHIDMDCFFVSVGLLTRPELKGKPVAVTHSRGQGAKPSLDSNLAWEKDQWMKKRSSVHLKGLRTSAAEDDTKTSGDAFVGSDAGSGASGNMHTFQSLAEIASCSYEARKAGVKNGMFVGTALNLCAGLQTIPYNFSEYNRVSRILYDVVASYTHDIEAVSCDELLIDCNDVLSDTGASAMEFAQVLRAEILEKTGCPSSVGIGPNILLARLATRKAKPNGQFEVTIVEAKDFIKDQPVSDLPGVGYSMSRKLTLLEVHTCGDLQKMALSTLKQEFGPKTGETLHRFSLGQDIREIKGDKERKSVSAEVNYGIRFSKATEAVTFLQDLSSEVKRRMDAIGVKGRSFTLKLMVRRPDAPVETAKFMGHGICNTFNKSSNLPVATNDEKVIAREVVSLYRAHRVEAADVRGIGIHINKLERTTTAKGLSSAAQRSGYQDMTSFTVHRPSNATTTTHSAVMSTSTTSTTCVPPASCNPVPLSSSGTSLSCNTSSSTLAYTSLRSSTRESSASLQTLRCEPDHTIIAVSSESTSKHPETACSIQDYSINRNSNIDLHFPPPENSSRFYKTKLVSEAKDNLENVNLVVQGQNAQLEKINSPAHSKLLTINYESKFDKPGPSWKVDVSESSTSCGQKFDGNTSFLSESQIDSDVLHELPAEIAQEILEDLRVRKQQKTSLSTVTPVTAPVHASPRNGSSPVHDSDKYAEGAVFHSRLPSLSQLDLSCFHALPLHLQDELRAEYARQEVSTQRSADKKAALAEGNLTNLKSPAKSSRSRQTNAELKNSKQPSRRGRQRGKRALNFGNSKVKSGRLDKNHQRDEKPCAPSLSSDVVVCISDEDGSSRDFNASEDSSDHQNLPGGPRHGCGFDAPADHVQPAANVRKGQAEDRQEDVTFCGASALEDVRKLMKEWMLSCPEPQDDDVSMVTEYLTKLVQHRNLEQTFSLLRFLTRRSQSQSHSRWKESLSNITTCVQTVVCACYGATLKL